LHKATQPVRARNRARAAGRRGPGETPDRNGPSGADGHSRAARVRNRTGTADTSKPGGAGSRRGSSGIASRREQKRRTRARVLRVALEEFARTGLLATRTIDVAKKARISHGSIFLHFGTREALIAAVIAEFGERLARRLHELAGEGKGVRDILEAHLRGLSEFEPFYARLVTEGPLLSKEARDALLGIQSAISHHLFEAAAREMNAGTIRRMPPHLLFNTWLGLLHHYVTNRDLFAPRASVIERRGRELLDHYMRLVST
jgi:AcrR family transcriptional regulator